MNTAKSMKPTAVAKATDDETEYVRATNSVKTLG